MIDNHINQLKLSGLPPYQVEKKRNASSPHCGAKDAELETKRPSHFEDGAEFDVSITRQHLVQIFKPDSGIARQLIHTLCAKNSAKLLCDMCRINLWVLNERIEVNSHILIGLEELRNIELIQFDVSHTDLLKPSRIAEGGLNTSRLGELVTICEQGYIFGSALITIQATPHTIEDANHRSPIPQLGKLSLEALNHENGFPRLTLPYGIRRVGRSLPFRNFRLLPMVAKFKQRRYRLPIAANSAIRVWSLDNAKGAQAPHKNTGAFFKPVVPIYGGCVWEALAPAGFLLPRLTNPHTARLHSFGHEGSGSPAKGAVPMQHILSLNPFKIRALAHRRMAFSALRADSALSIRLKRYNSHMSIARTIQVLSGEPTLKHNQEVSSWVA